ncbi:phosphohexomutase domain-containing protein [Pararhizobium mangrovi]|uniref:Phosphomannomutase n=1 Tax=Pararhizobium mangrovi TaxID=2590452 RepID=A0A506TZR7_9HYPH|nr:phosphomannomutase [Pararhizobium mangrovi]TPW27572.1 phosphomannomutase [Pararhizobium mangrovi]
MAAPFKAYDVRGSIPGEINAAFAYRFAQAASMRLQPSAVVLGHDMRADSPALASSLAQGFLDCGVDVLPLGQCGTEEVYFHTARTDADAGLMVTASHNPASDNGIKMVLKGATAATRDNAFDGIEERVRQFGDLARVPVFSARGGLHPVLDRTPYIERLLERVADRDLVPLTIVCHAGNGCAGPVIDALEPYLPFTFVKVDHEPDARLPNGVPNPLLPDKRDRASRAVIETGADLGIAWDGDFDRCFFYDHTGRFIEGYYLVGLIARMVLAGEPGATILHDPRLVWNTEDIVAKAGGTAKPCPVGHAFFRAMMRDEDAAYGGEMSAHHYFREFAYCDTGMLPWLAIAAEISATGTRLYDLVQERIEAFPCSGEVNFTVDDPETTRWRIAEHYLAADPEIEEIDGLSMAFDDWRFNLRSSNTEPLLRLNVETRADGGLLERRLGELSALIRAK